METLGEIFQPGTIKKALKGPKMLTNKQETSTMAEMTD